MSFALAASLILASSARAEAPQALPMVAAATASVEILRPAQVRQGTGAVTTADGLRYHLTPLERAIMVEFE